ncbi:MAG: glycerol-3-phosphate 1-O-acyltransferase PlsY [Caedimonadaceae bacterium]|nr:MAG: glycerol-3-phosphate 1-O-acyltransferase PlsY [Caedimonadaceae bacterium]
MNYWIALCAMILGYLFGSIPFGLIFTRIFEKKDIRALGSGNIGATNVLRTGNKKLALLTLLFDALKGVLPILLIGIFLGQERLALMCAGLGSVVGHIYPIWLKFKGGKGVATGLGVITTLAWPVALATISIWIAVAFIFRYSSLGALIAFLCCPLIAYYTTNLIYLLGFLLISILIIFKHRSNMIRLLTGTEPKIGEKP